MVSIWVDADACPVVIREIIVRAANRTGTSATFVANNFLKLPPSPHIRFRQVPKGFDVADNEIVASVAAGDLVITGDIPLAAEVMGKGAQALNPRGEHYSEDTIGQKLNMRDFMDTMRASGVQSGGQPPMSKSDRQAFANALDRFLASSATTQAAPEVTKNNE